MKLCFPFHLFPCVPSSHLNTAIIILLIGMTTNVCVYIELIQISSTHYFFTFILNNSVLSKVETSTEDELFHQVNAKGVQDITQSE